MVGESTKGEGWTGDSHRAAPHRDVIEGLLDPLQVAVAAAVGVLERARIDLVDDGVPPPHAEEATCANGYEKRKRGIPPGHNRVIHCKERSMIGMLIVVLFAALVYIILAALTGSAIVGAVLVLLAGLPTGGFGLGHRFGGGLMGGGRAGGGRLGRRGPRY